MGFAHLRRHASLWLARLRQSSRIAFSLRRRALLRLIACAGIARRLEKCWGKTGAPVFHFFFHYLFL